MLFGALLLPGAASAGELLKSYVLEYRVACVGTFGDPCSDSTGSPSVSAGQVLTGSFEYDAGELLVDSISRPSNPAHFFMRIGDTVWDSGVCLLYNDPGGCPEGTTTSGQWYITVESGELIGMGYNMVRINSIEYLSFYPSSSKGFENNAARQFAGFFDGGELYGARGTLSWSVVSEPYSLALIGFGLAGIAVMRRSRRCATDA